MEAERSLELKFREAVKLSLTCGSKKDFDDFLKVLMTFSESKNNIIGRLRTTLRETAARRAASKQFEEFYKTKSLMMFFCQSLEGK